MGGAAKSVANVASGGIYGAITGSGTPGWVDYIPGVGDVANTIERAKDGDWWGALDRSVDPFGGVHNISGWLGEHTMNQGMRDAAPAIGGLIGNYVGGPWVGAIGSGIGSELAGADAKTKYKNAGMAFAGGYLGKGVSGGGWDFGGTSGGTMGAAGSGPVAGSGTGGGVASSSYQGTLGPEYTSSLLDSSGSAASSATSPYATNYTGMLGEQIGSTAGSAAGASATQYPYSLGQEPYNASMTDMYIPPDTKFGDGINGDYKFYDTPKFQESAPIQQPSGMENLNQYTPLYNSPEPSVWQNGLNTVQGWGEQGWDKTTDYTKQKWNSWFGSEQGAPQPTGQAGQNTAGGKAGGKGMLQQYGLPLAVLGGLNYYGSQQNKKLAEELYNQQKADIAAAQASAMSNWKTNAFPNESAIASARTTGKSNIAEGAKSARRSLDESLAARGIAGGGVAAGEYGKIERDKMRRMAELANQLTQYANTPYGAPPIMTAYPQMQSYTPWQTGLANTGNQLAGMYMMNQMLRG